MGSMQCYTHNVKKIKGTACKKGDVVNEPLFVRLKQFKINILKYDYSMTLVFIVIQG